MTDHRDKQRQRDRYLKASKHQLTPEQRRQLAEARKQRGDRRRGGDDDVDEQGFQKIRRRERVLTPTAGAAATTPNTSEGHGTIVWLSRGRALVRDGDGEREARLAPELARVQQTAVAVGDEAVLHELPDGTTMVVAIEERRSELVRTDPGNEHRRRVLAANVDVVVLVLTVERPRLGLIDRLATALADSGAELAVCINKRDLPHDLDALERELRRHRQQQVAIALTSATTGDGLDELGAIVRGRTAVMVGHSGVGKSTLLNRLDPGAAERATGAVRERDGKGRHTTTASRLSVLADGTRLIDTPGVRAFGLADGHSDSLAAFEDIAALADGCRFRDCRHRSEPSCAVRAAVESGEFDAERYQSYLRLQDNP